MGKCSMCGGSLINKVLDGSPCRETECTSCHRRTVNGVVVEPGTIRRPDAPAIKR